MNGKVNNILQIGGIRRYTMTEGAEKGLDVLDCDNGKIRFLLNLSRACDVMQLYHEGQNVSFISKNGFISRTAPFLKHFEGGMLYTCGLDSVGVREGYETHGSLHLTPARLLLAVCDEDGIRVEAEICASALFGEDLVLHRTVTAKAGSETLTVTDVLENRGYSSQNYCVLYHCNVGYPMLDEGATLAGDVISCLPRTPFAKERMAAREKFGAPVPGEDETCYFLTFGKPEAVVTNPALGKKFTLRWSADTLPRFVEWKCMASGDYALGLEPSTTELDDRFAYKTIGAGEKITNFVSFTVEKF